MNRLIELQESIGKAQQRVGEIDDEIAELQRELVTQAEVNSALDDFESLWDKLKPIERQQMFQQIIKQIVYDGRDGQVAITFHGAGLKTMAEQVKEEAS